MTTRKYVAYISRVVSTVHKVVVEFDDDNPLTKIFDSNGVTGLDIDNIGGLGSGDGNGYGAIRYFHDNPTAADDTQIYALDKFYESEITPPTDEYREAQSIAGTGQSPEVIRKMGFISARILPPGDTTQVDFTAPYTL